MEDLIRKLALDLFFFNAIAFGCSWTLAKKVIALIDFRVRIGGYWDGNVSVLNDSPSFERSC